MVRPDCLNAVADDHQVEVDRRRRGLRASRGGSGMRCRVCRACAAELLRIGGLSGMHRGVCRVCVAEGLAVFLAQDLVQVDGFAAAADFDGS